MHYSGASFPALSSVDVAVERGRFAAVLGPNGSGKSTLLRVMLGEIDPTAGRCEYEGRLVSEWGRREIAREVAFVPQSERLAFPIKVRDLVEMGRYPHVGTLGRLGISDREAVARALNQAGVSHLADRPMDTLSGGERQRARIARALAQTPKTIVLDEPTAALDLRFEMETFELLRSLSSEHEITVLAATHNLNLAARFAADLVLLSRGTVAAAGAPEVVLRSDVLDEVYEWPVAVTQWPRSDGSGKVPQVTPMDRTDHLDPE